MSGTIRTTGAAVDSAVLPTLVDGEGDAVVALFDLAVLLLWLLLLMVSRGGRPMMGEERVELLKSVFRLEVNLLAVTLSLSLGGGGVNLLIVRVFVAGDLALNLLRDKKDGGTGLSMDSLENSSLPGGARPGLANLSESVEENFVFEWIPSDAIFGLPLLPKVGLVRAGFPASTTWP